MNKILVLNYSRMGDLLQSIPLLYKIKRLHPDCWLEMIVPWEFKNISAVMPVADRVYTLNDSEIKDKLSKSSDWVEAYCVLEDVLEPLKKQNFDVAYNMVYSENGAMILKALDVKEVFGYKLEYTNVLSATDPWFAYLCNFYGFVKYNPFNLTDIFRQCGGIDPEPAEYSTKEDSSNEQSGIDFLKRVRTDESRSLIALQPGSNSPDRRIDPEIYSNAADLLAENFNADVLVLGAPDEAELVDRIVSAANRKEVISGICSLEELIGILKHVQLLITNDTGTMHLAAALKTRILLLSSGCSNPVISGPYLENSFALAPLFECQPCRPSNICSEMPCRDKIPPQAIFDTAVNMLNGTSEFQIKNAKLFRIEKDRDGFMRAVPFPGKAVTAGEWFTELWTCFWKRLTGVEVSESCMYTFDDLGKHGAADLHNLKNDINIFSTEISELADVLEKSANELEESLAVFKQRVPEAMSNEIPRIKSALQLIDVQTRKAENTCALLAPYVKMMNHQREHIFHDDPVELLKPQIQLLRTYKRNIIWVKELAQKTSEKL